MARHKGPRKPPAQKKPPLTHFLCLPLVTAASRPQLETSLERFTNDVSAKDPKIRGNSENTDDNDDTTERVLPVIHPKAIRPVGALHCTLGVMSLDKDKLSQAVDFLDGIDIASLLTADAEKPGVLNHKPTPDDDRKKLASLERSISPPRVERPSAVRPLTVDLEGLVSMHSPSKTSILYTAPEDATGRLYPFCVTLQKLFGDKGFLVKDDRQLKLHATLVNTIYAKGRKTKLKPSAKQQTSEPSSAQPASSGQAIEPDAAQDRSSGHGPHANAPIKIDATAIIEKYRDFVWAERIVLDRVSICEMGAKKITDAQGNVLDEGYTEVANLSLTT